MRSSATKLLRPSYTICARSSLRISARSLHVSPAAMGDIARPQPAKRFEGVNKDVWSIINDAAMKSKVQPLVNMGQGFYGYNPPDFVIKAAQDALTRVECNQYSPTRGRPRLKKAIADAYTPLFKRTIDPETEVTITSGANEGCFSAFLGFLQAGDECIIFEPYFDQYVSNIEMAGGKVVYVPLHPPENATTKTTPAGDWWFDMEELKAAFTPRTKMIVVNSPHNPVGKIFSREEMQAIGDLCVKHNVICLSDEVYDKLYYTEFTRMSMLSPEIEQLTITVGSGGKIFQCTGWRIGYLIGPAHLIKYAAMAHTRVCFCSVSPLQEGIAVAFEEADKHNFYETQKREMWAKIQRFCAVFDELGMPYSVPQGGYFVLANMAKINLPEDYEWSEDVKQRSRDFRLAEFLIKEIGLAAIPPTEFMTPSKKYIVEDFLRFSVCKTDDVLEDAKERLRGLKKFMT